MPTEDKKEVSLYRYSGYQLPKIELDETGPSYYVVSPHPYLRNQPTLWQSAWSLGPYHYMITGHKGEGAAMAMEEEIVCRKNTSSIKKMLPF